MINYAIIPARGGSKVILKKNINRIIVSANDPKIADITIKFAAKAFLLRPKKFSQDFLIDLEFILYLFNWFHINTERKFI